MALRRTHATTKSPLSASNCIHSQIPATLATWFFSPKSMLWESNENGKNGKEIERKLLDLSLYLDPHQHFCILGWDPSSIKVLWRPFQYFWCNTKPANQWTRLKNITSLAKVITLGQVWAKSLKVLPIIKDWHQTNFNTWITCILCKNMCGFMLEWELRTDTTARLEIHIYPHGRGTFVGINSKCI